MIVTPTVGRIVHYVLKDGSFKGEHRAAIITSTWNGPNQNLTVFLDQSGDLPSDRPNPEFLQMMRVWSAPFDETGEPGTWHWPERT